MILLVALSTHAVFEGIALGLTPETTAIINIMLGLMCHKGPAAMSLGISLSRKFKRDEDRRKAIYLIILFALATPVGIGMGMLLQAANDIIEVIFSSFAGGTFIYIAASEVIVEEFALKGGKLVKMLFFTLGAIIISLMWLLESD
jgi:zinc transporter 1/2/3